MRVIIVPFHDPELVKHATLEERQAMLEEWKAQMRRWNPHFYNADGSTKSWWRVLLGL